MRPGMNEVVKNTELALSSSILAQRRSYLRTQRVLSEDILTET